jgi:hypothetical protein
MPNVSPAALGVAWGALAAVLFVRPVHRADLTARFTSPASGTRSRRQRHTLVTDLERAAGRVLRFAGPVRRVARGVADRARDRRHAAALARELPVTIDLLAVAVGAGCTPYLAVETASVWAPPISANACASVIAACAVGGGFEPALDAVARNTPRLRALADALLVSDRTGAPVGGALSRLASEERAALRRRAEAHARRVPVRLLFPLVFLVLPAFVLLTVVPGLAAGLSRL